MNYKAMADLIARGASLTQAARALSVSPGVAGRWYMQLSAILGTATFGDLRRRLRELGYGPDEVALWDRDTFLARTTALPAPEPILAA